MQRKALLLSLAVALLFAMLPGIAMLAAERHGAAHDGTVQIDGASPPGASAEPVALGFDTGPCPGEDGGDQARF